ncbi:FecR domain-containing protein [uncultured Sanguibacteroides sp.]|uniref:FecR family protein n=1 Tax=uncultured Sanguibacteroides sp. TaxID=1635151 RepID=UPI0025DFC562|nr:FecR domain-containing protein [uncultured Sanguibacteroides sp.]
MDTLKERLEIARKMARELAGILDEGEREGLIRWLTTSSVHQNEFDELQKSIASGKIIGQEQEEGRRLVEREWRRFKRRTESRRKRWIGWSRYAAVFILLLATGLYYFMDVGFDRNPPLQTTAIVPGKAKAQLILEDGRRLQLDRGTPLQILELEKAGILASDSVIKYVAKESLPENESQERYNTLIVPNGGEFHVELADGTVVWLNAGSSLHYPVSFTGEERRVKMTGEVYFEVTKDTAKPFIVTVNGVDIRVLGTSFNISAYGEEVVTTLLEGKVRLTHERDEVELKPDQQGVWQPEAGTFVIKQVEARNYILWKEGMFYFEDTDLESILDAMARWYNVNIFYVNPALKLLRFNVEIKRYENIETILKRIEQTDKVKFDVKDKIIRVYE